MDAITIAGSALTAQSVNVGVIAGNIANVETPDYTAKQAALVPMTPGGGVEVGAIIDTGQGVDLANQLVNLSMAKTAYEAATNVLTTASEMTSALLAAI
ncbi:MAG TPA: flagellar basal body rod C-terminal domain-containing protein [Stellaceae bacterium]|jgi:flagellar basal body rod protein FlgC